MSLYFPLLYLPCTRYLFPLQWSYCGRSYGTCIPSFCCVYPWPYRGSVSWTLSCPVECSQFSGPVTLALQHLMNYS
jgi:hypothetical protein